MEIINNIKDKLSGLKTYLVGLGAIITAVLAFEAGTVDIVTTVQSIFAAIMAMTIRAGVETNKDAE